MITGCPNKFTWTISPVSGMSATTYRGELVRVPTELLGPVAALIPWVFVREGDGVTDERESVGTGGQGGRLMGLLRLGDPPAQGEEANEQPADDDE